MTSKQMVLARVQARLPVADKKRRRASWFAPVQRCYIRMPNGTLIRWLLRSTYSELGGERSFFLRLRSNDPRPLGIRYHRRYGDAYTDAYYANWLRHLPLGQWVEIEFAPRAPQPLLLLPAPAEERRAS